jgi:PAS domain S-box-containing protein
LHVAARTGSMNDLPLDFEQLVRSAGDAVVVANGEGSIVFWNGAAERIFGFNEAEALGCSLDLIIPERLRARHWNGYENVMATGETRYGSEVLRVPAVHKDGRALSIAFTVTLLGSPGGPPHAIAAIMCDETSRWQEERDLRRRLAELERKRS